MKRLYGSESPSDKKASLSASSSADDFTLIHSTSKLSSSPTLSSSPSKMKSHDDSAETLSSRPKKLERRVSETRGLRASCTPDFFLPINNTLPLKRKQQTTTNSPSTQQNDETSVVDSLDTLPSFIPSPSSRSSRRDSRSRHLKRRSISAGPTSSGRYTTAISSNWNSSGESAQDSPSTGEEDSPGPAVDESKQRKKTPEGKRRRSRKERSNSTGDGREHKSKEVSKKSRRRHGSFTAVLTDKKKRLTRSTSGVLSTSPSSRKRAGGLTARANSSGNVQAIAAQATRNREFVPRTNSSPNLKGQVRLDDSQNEGGAAGAKSSEGTSEAEGNKKENRRSWGDSNKWKARLGIANSEKRKDAATSSPVPNPKARVLHELEEVRLNSNIKSD